MVVKFGKEMDKRALTKQYKQSPPLMGILLVRNLANGKIFIDSAQNVQGRLNSCKFQLTMGSHMNHALQEDFKKYGEASFTFEIVDTMEPKETTAENVKDIKQLEEMWLEKLQPFGEKGYNRRPGKPGPDATAHS